MLGGCNSKSTQRTQTFVDYTNDYIQYLINRGSKGREFKTELPKHILQIGLKVAATKVMAFLGLGFRMFTRSLEE